MAKFVYKFDSIKKVKETLEKKVQKEVAAITMEIERNEYEYMLVEREISRSKGNSKKKNYKMSEIQFQKNYEKILIKKLEEIRHKIDLLLLQKDKKIEELKQRSMEHEIFNTLEENYLEEFNNEQKKIELKQIDEIAVQKFAGNNK